jgi:hypothetical protein
MSDWEGSLADPRRGWIYRLLLWSGLKSGMKRGACVGWPSDFNIRILSRQATDLTFAFELADQHGREYRIYSTGAFELHQVCP